MTRASAALRADVAPGEAPPDGSGGRDGLRGRRLLVLLVVSVVKRIHES
jgi:hypothetical protein